MINSLVNFKTLDRIILLLTINFMSLAKVSNLNDAIRHSNTIVNNSERFSHNVVERAIVFLSLNDDNFVFEDKLA